MKKLILLFVSVFALSFVGCSDDDIPNIDASKLTGVWILDKVVLTNGETLDLTICKKQETLTFSSNNKVSWHTPEEDLMTSPCSFFDYDMTYSVSGNKVIANWNGTDFEFNAVNVSSNILTFKGNDWVATFKR